MTDDRHMDETQPDQAQFDRTGSSEAKDSNMPSQPTRPDVEDEQAEREAPRPGTAGVGNTGVTPPQVEGGQPPVGEPDQRETRSTEF